MTARLARNSSTLRSTRKKGYFIDNVATDDVTMFKDKDTRKDHFDSNYISGSSLHISQYQNSIKP